MTKHIITGSVIDDSYPLSVKVVAGNIVLDASDIEIGAVELKNATDDTRAVVGANGLFVDVRSLPAIDNAITVPTIYNITLTNANTEYSQALPANCRLFEFQCRTENEIRFAFVTEKVATPTAPWMTLKAGDYYVSPHMFQGASPSTLYFATAVAGVIVSIIAWT